ncbi:MAG: hypothetical protein HZB75_03435 [Candidatus Saccharibacteria bacterium]|nr:MAG: hypothetical protein HZB75_03435 [Candidatus Saccharibacteria bacterium]
MIEEIMARLPQPGQDENVWGDVLNDFLSQSLTGAGLLKAGTVDTTQLTDNSVDGTKLQDNSVTADHLTANAVTTGKIAAGAVTGTQIADGSVTSAKLASGIIPDTSDGLRSLCIFYSAPNIANAAYSDDYAAGYLSRFNDVVLGNGLQDPGHQYYASSVAILQKIADIGTDTVIWGYIDAGVTTSNLSLPALQVLIDQWIDIGVTNIFIDLFGYDYGVTRARQNAILDYIHAQNCHAFINVWNMDDAFSSAVNVTYNPSGIATTANSGDVVLLESWICNSDAYSAPHFATMSDIKTRGDKARAYRTSLGIRIYAVNIFEHNGATTQELDNYYGVSEAFARAFRLDGSGLMPSNFSSTGNDIGRLAPRRSTFGPLPFRPTATYWLNNTWTQVQAPDLGVIANLDTGTWERL